MPEAVAKVLPNHILSSVLHDCYEMYTGMDFRMISWVTGYSCHLHTLQGDFSKQRLKHYDMKAARALYVFPYAYSCLVSLQLFSSRAVAFSSALSATQTQLLHDKN